MFPVAPLLRCLCLAAVPVQLSHLAAQPQSPHRLLSYPELSMVADLWRVDHFELWPIHHVGHQLRAEDMCLEGSPSSVAPGSDEQDNDEAAEDCQALQLE